MNAAASWPSSSSAIGRPEIVHPGQRDARRPPRHHRDRPQADRGQPQAAGAGEQQRDRDADEHRLADLVLLARDVGQRAARRRARTWRRRSVSGSTWTRHAPADVDRSGRAAGLPPGMHVGEARADRSCAPSTSPLRVEDRDRRGQLTRSRCAPPSPPARGVSSSPQLLAQHVRERAWTLSSSRSTRRMPIRCCVHEHVGAEAATSTTRSASVYQSVSRARSDSVVIVRRSPIS